MKLRGYSARISIIIIFRLPHYNVFSGKEEEEGKITKVRPITKQKKSVNCVKQ